MRIRAARAFVRRHLGAAVHERDENLPRDHKSELQALVLADTGALPRYRLVEEAGPDHSKRFVFESSRVNCFEPVMNRSDRNRESSPTLVTVTAWLAATPRVSAPKSIFFG